MGADKLIIFLTKRCTRDCAFCIDKQNVKYYKNELYRTGFMEDGVYREALEFAEANGIRRIQFNGGEPTLHPGLLVYVKAAKARGFGTEIVTNYDLPDVVASLDGVVDEIFISYYGQRFLPYQRDFDSKLTLRIALTRSTFPTLDSLVDFLRSNGGRFSDFKITTLIENNDFSRAEQVDYLERLQEASPMYEAENGKRYHDFMGYRIKRLDLENRRLDVGKTSFKVHVDGVISRYSEEDHYTLGDMDQSSELTKELRATRDPILKQKIVEAHEILGDCE